MNFLSPMFLIAGGLLVSLPIVIHLLNRRRHKTVEWAAMRYLLAAVRQNRRRMQFESWLLLLLRCLAIGLLAFAMARPLGCGSNAGGADALVEGLHVLVIDDSLSMRQRAGDGSTLLQESLRDAGELLDRLEPGRHRVAIIRAGAPARMILEPTSDLEVARRSVSRIEATFDGNDLVGALRLAEASARAAADMPNRSVHLWTDRSRGSLPTESAALREAGRAVGDVARVRVIDMGRADASNRAVVGVGVSEPMVKLGFPAELAADVIEINAGDAGSGRSMIYQVDGREVGRSSFPEAGSTPVRRLMALSDVSRSGPVVVSAAIDGTDDLPEDDSRSSVIDVAGGLAVLIVEGRSGGGALGGSGAFLRIALAPTVEGSGGRATSYVAPEVISDAELTGRALAGYRVVMLAGVGVIDLETARQLARFVEEGGSLVMFMGEPVRGEVYNQTLGAVGLLPGELVTRVDALTGQTGSDEHATADATAGTTFDFDPRSPHPVLAAFANYPRSGLDAATISTWWRIAIDEKKNVDRILSFKSGSVMKSARDADVGADGGSGDAAIMMHRLGAGRVMTVATSADAEWSTLVARPAYVTLVHELLGAVVGQASDWMNRRVGETLRLPQQWSGIAGEIRLVDPQGARRVLARDAEGRLEAVRVDRPGVWVIETDANDTAEGTEASKRMPVAVVIDPRESDLALVDRSGYAEAVGLSPVEWTTIRAEVDGSNQPADDASTASSTGSEASNAGEKEWTWGVLFALLLVLLGETFLAERSSRGAIPGAVNRANRSVREARPSIGGGR